MSNRNNSSNTTGMALTFGIGAALGAATYFLINAVTEEQPHQQQSSRRSSGRSSEESQKSSAQSKKWRDNGNRPDTCSICLEQIPPMSARTLLGCGHEFHTSCVEPWVARSANCPVCRQEIQ